jgi:hypothetical protein
MILACNVPDAECAQAEGIIHVCNMHLGHASSAAAAADCVSIIVYTVQVVCAFGTSLA